MAPTLETPRLFLRLWRDSDIEPWVTMSADPRVMEFLSESVALRSDAEDTVSRLRNQLESDGFGWWVLEVKGGPSFAGAICIQRVPIEAHFTPAIEVGWRLAYDCWGQGYAIEGARAALAFAFDDLKIEEVVAMTAVLNVRSRRVMERLGMTYSPADDFENPRDAEGHRIRPHALYRTRR
jgi:RimJ/RimL family protein N-acetyltransferase